jgi:DNA end-binding protein Ku
MQKPRAFPGAFYLSLLHRDSGLVDVVAGLIPPKGMVAIGKIVFTSREHIIALEARGKGLLGVTLRYPYEVRNEADYFDAIADENSKGYTRSCLAHRENEGGHFQPSKFEDQYEDALKGGSSRDG